MMKGATMKRQVFRFFRGAGLSALAGLLLFSCGLKKSEHFGTSFNFPVFQGPGDFFRSLGKVTEISAFHKLDGKAVDLSWITPAFREKLCLSVTIANHCVA